MLYIKFSWWGPNVIRRYVVMCLGTVEYNNKTCKQSLGTQTHHTLNVPLPHVYKQGDIATKFVKKVDL